MKFSFLVLEIVSADPAGLVMNLNNAGVTVYHIQQVGDLSFLISVKESSYSQVCSITQSRSESCKIHARLGVFRYIKMCLRRPLFVCTAIILVCMTVLLSGRVLFIRVEGNQLVSKEEILYAASQNGIYFGAKRKLIRNEIVKNGVIGAIPEIQWVGVNTNGCVAVISVEEERMDKQSDIHTGVSSIVACRDAMVTRCVAERGTLLCTPGQIVKHGDVLISGYTDCGIKIQAGHADGEIYGYTVHEKTALIPLIYDQKSYSGQQERAFSLLLGKNCINLWKDSRISGTDCDKIYEEYYIVLPGGFILPAGFRVDIFHNYTQSSYTYDQTISSKLASNLCDRAVVGSMIAGTILQASSNHEILSDVLQLDKNYFCEELIGRRQTEEIMDSYG